MTDTVPFYDTLAFMFPLNGNGERILPERDSALDFELLAQVVKWARAEYDTGETSMWYQANYAVETECGTACCIAGRVALTSGFSIASTDWFTAARWDFANGQPPVPVDAAGEAAWHNIGRDILGLHEAEAVVLFSGSNTIEDVERISRDIATYHGYTPSW